MSRSPHRSRSSDAPSSAPSYTDVDPDALVRVGFVFRPHGVQGELKVDPEATDDPRRFESFDTVYVGSRRQAVAEHTVASVRYQETKRGTTVILRLQDVQSRTDAEAVTKHTLFVHEDDLDLDEDELFIHDLIGLDVVTDAGDPVGTVANLVAYPGHDTLVVTRPDRRETLIPAVDEFIVDIDLDAGRIVVRPIEGLLE